MEVTFSLFAITLLVLQKPPNIDGVSDSHIVAEEDWADPFDMINYDRASKSMIGKSRNPTPGNENLFREAAITEKELTICKAKLDDCSKQLLNLKYSPSSTLPPKIKGQITNKIMNGVPKSTGEPTDNFSKEDCNRSQVYMRRFVNILLKASKLNEDMPQNLNTKLHITVTTEQLKILQQFSKGSKAVTLQELDSVLSSVLLSASSNIFSEDYIPWSVAINFVQSREMLLALVLGFLPVFLVWKILNGHSLMRILSIFLMASFIISFSVTYCRMYKQAEIKQYAMMKRNPDIPVECRPPTDLTWMETIGELFRSKFLFHPDACQKYYEAVMLDPFLEVTPALVLSEMTASFLLHPSGKLGSAIANFSNSILGNLPFGTNWLVLIASFFLAVIIIIASCGGVIRLPFYLGGIELSGRRSQEKITLGPQNNQEVEQPQVRQALNDSTLKSLMQVADQTDTGLIIMNVHGMQRLLSTGNTTVVCRNTIEEIQLPSPKKKENEKFETEAMVHVPGCCGESVSKCHHVMGHESVIEGPVVPRKNRTEELRMRRTTVISNETKAKCDQAESEKVIPVYFKGEHNKEGRELSPTKCCGSCVSGKEAFTSCKVTGTGGSNRTESEVEEVNICRSSIDGLDDDNEETSFVKL